MDRFWWKVEQTDSCWIWKGSKDSRGYGEFWFNRKLWKAHRFSYTKYIGEIPEGYHIDHLCGNTSCVKPKHLEAVTQQENNKRTKKPHCRRDHPRTGSICPICQKEWKLKNKERIKEYNKLYFQSHKILT